jgi:hypothetical protein
MGLEVEVVQSKKWLIFGCLVFMINVGMVWADEPGFQLVVGRGSKLCEKVLDAFSEDVDDRGQPRYQHEIFRQITWKPVELRGKGQRRGIVQVSIRR